MIVYPNYFQLQCGISMCTFPVAMLSAYPYAARARLRAKRTILNSCSPSMTRRRLSTGATVYTTALRILRS